MNKLADELHAPTDPPAAQRRSGRVTFDADGRGVWEWQISIGVFTRTVTEDQLLQLAATNLQLLEPARQQEDPLKALMRPADA